MDQKQLAQDILTEILVQGGVDEETAQEYVAEVAAQADNGQES